MPEVPAGPYADHMALDLKGERLFTTPQANKAVDVIDLKTGRVLHTIGGFGNPHAILYSRTGIVSSSLTAASARCESSMPPPTGRSNRSNSSWTPMESVMTRRPGYLYVSNGGDAAGKEYTLISIIDTAREEKIGDIRVDAPGLEAMVIDHAGGRLYVDLPEENAIAVVDLKQRAVIATWPLTRGKGNMALALDAGHKLLYVGCRDTDVRGSILVFDAETGKELERLPIGGWVDSLFYDRVKGRIYASAGVGEIFTYERRQTEASRHLEPVDTAVMAKTALYSPDLDRLFVAVPHLGGTMSKVLVFKPQ